MHPHRTRAVPGNRATRPGSWVRSWVLALVVLLAPLVGGFSSSADTGALAIHALSNRADLITGGDALIEVVLPANVEARDVEVWANDNRVTAKFAIRDDGRYLGLVTGLRAGQNRLTAYADGERTGIDLINHPIGGPVFSGPQVTPWICETEKAGLGPAQDAQCNAATRVDYLYRPTGAQDGGLRPYDVDNPPADVASTTTDQGEVVPYIVRRETGTANRGMYQISVLDDPSTEPKPWARPEGWNGKLYYFFQGGAVAQYRQGVVAGTADPSGLDTSWYVPSDLAISRGFAVATSTLAVGGQNTNTVVSAEALMMVKERITEQFGEIRYTMSTGCSGGSVQQHVIADTYPGLLDGILPSCGYPDWVSANTEPVDCSLLDRFFDRTGRSWSDRERDAVLGGASGNCDVWIDSQLYRHINDPEVGCILDEAGQQPDWAYSRRNPDGTRCTFWDNQIAVDGERDPSSWGPVERRLDHGFANRPLDNVGVQYGLKALQTGGITPQQFLSLNRHTGGYDIDLNWTHSRTTADLPALKAAYRTYLTYGANLETVPIIDYRLTQNHGGHPNWRSQSMRARLIGANGDADNQVIWVSDLPQTGPREQWAGEYRALTERAFRTMDGWLSAIEADNSGHSLADKVVANKPDVAVDTCWIDGEETTDQRRCEAEIPDITNPRIVAGGPLTDDVLKCQVKPLNRSDYPTAFTRSQWHRLQRIFPHGVCDFDKPGVAHQPTRQWLSFANGPKGEPLGVEETDLP